jgi:hypothetical protein
VAVAELVGAGFMDAAEAVEVVLAWADSGVVFPGAQPLVGGASFGRARPSAS